MQTIKPRIFTTIIMAAAVLSGLTGNGQQGHLAAQKATQKRARKTAQEAKETKEAKEAKETKETQEEKEAKEEKETKEETSAKEPEEKAAPKERPAAIGASLTGKLDPQYYFIANTVIWESSRGDFLGGMIETKKRPTDNVSPASRITIKNLSSNVILYESDFEGVPNSMYIRNLTPDEDPEVVVDMGIAASSNQFQIFTVTPTKASLILDVNYAQDATLIDLGNDDAIDVLITTGDSQIAPLTTTLYYFKGDRYKSAGEISYKRMRLLLNKQFGRRTISAR